MVSEVSEEDSHGSSPSSIERTRHTDTADAHAHAQPHAHTNAHARILNGNDNVRLNHAIILSWFGRSVYRFRQVAEQGKADKAEQGKSRQGRARPCKARQIKVATAPSSPSSIAS